MTKPTPSIVPEYFYTTGEVAKILRVGVRTVAKWTDSGRLKCRTNPGSSHRRIREVDLIEFMNAHGIVPHIPSMRNEEPAKTIISPSIPQDSYVFFRDGKAWCCTRTDFINLQESPAGFGVTLYEAMESFREAEKLHSSRSVGTPPEGSGEVLVPQS